MLQLGPVLVVTPGPWATWTSAVGVACASLVDLLAFSIVGLICLFPWLSFLLGLSECPRHQPPSISVFCFSVPPARAPPTPLDYPLWHEIERRMVQRQPAKVETVEGYKKRLRLVALRLPRRVVLKAVGALPRRVKAVIEAKGNSIPRG